MMSKTGSKRGFTLVEILVATAVLSLGIAFIYEAFFISLSAFDYCYNYLNIASWADEKIWQAQDSLTRFGDLERVGKEGEFLAANKKFTYALSGTLIDNESKLYKIDLLLFWREGRKERRLLRAAYAAYEEPKD